MRSKVAAAALVLASAASAAAQPVDWSHAQSVNVEMIDNKFVPDHLTFQHGTPYRLHLENHGKDLHEFTAPAFLKAIEISNPEVLNQEGTEIVVEPGQAKDLYFVPKQAGRFPFACADHDWAGMTGDIVVE